MLSRTDEFIIALQDEVTYARKGTDKALLLSGGRLQRQLGEHLIYDFETNISFLFDDDSPATLEIENTIYECFIVASQDLLVQIATRSHLGDYVEKARLISNQSETFSRLLEKFEKARKDEKLARDRTNIFSVAEDVFIGRTRELLTPAGHAAFPQYSYDSENTPNDAQKAAIQNSFSNSLAIIWGPPGTGKTTTIARAVEAHLHAGRRILFVAHANTTVDAALIDIAQQVKNSFYSQGSLLRLGVPKDTTLEQRFPLVLAEKQIEMDTVQLLQEQSRIEASLPALRSKIDNCGRLLTIVDKVKTLERKIQKPEESASAKILQRQKQLQSEIEHAQTQLVTAQHHLKSLIGPAYFTYETVIKDLNIFIGVRKGMIDELGSKIVAQIGDESPEMALDSAYEELDQIMSLTGLNPNEAAKEKKEAQIILDELQVRLKPVKKQITEAQDQIISRAKLVATTLSKVFTSSALEREMFDILIVDEASMVHMPSLYWALTKVKQGATIVGDFKQLPPTAAAKTDMAGKWLRRNIFDELRIASVEAACRNARVSMLDIQYRMNNKIADVANKLVYGGLLKSAQATKSLSLSDNISGNSALTIIDTSAVNPNCIQIAEGSRLNIYSAGLCATLCRQLLSEHPSASIGIVTVYKKQAELIDKILIDCSLQSKVKVSTIHKFQSDESTIIIFDCVDGLGSKRSSLDDSLKGSSAEVLLNVALTRAQAKFFLVINQTYFATTLAPDSILLKFIAAITLDGSQIDSRTIDENFSARSIEIDGAKIARATREGNSSGSLFNEKNFWDTFYDDLTVAQNSVLLASPFVTIKRSRSLVPKIQSLLSRGIEVRLYTKTIDEHSQTYMSEDAAQVISMLQKMGVEVIQLSDMHQKVALIDDHICWEGSLNILSHTGNPLEQMRRLTGSATALAIKENLRM